MSKRRAPEAPRRPPYTALEIAAAWREALALWDVAVELSPPAPLERAKGSHWPGGEPLAFIDMITRQVVVNLELLVEVGVRASLAAVLAHEIGHHVRFPHTLGLAARLALLQKRLIPNAPESLPNLFFDLQVNEVVGRTHAARLADVYRGFAATEKALTPLHCFYLAIYEELWGLAAGTLAHDAERHERAFPGLRAEARQFAQTFWSLPGDELPFVYFCSRVLRYCPPESPGLGKALLPMGGDVCEPDVDDWDGALSGSPLADAALEEAEARGWLSAQTERERDAARANSGADAIGRIGGLPGSAQAKFREVLALRQYRRLVEAHLITIPASAPPPDPLVPVTLEEWQLGDDPRAIDWTASVLARGPLAGAMPLRRELEPDVPAAVAAERPAVEIYLDTSGSMPNPQHAQNAMTLAALVLATSAIRKQGQARGVIYSAGKPLVSGWMQEEETAQRFLLRYAGGGTEFPFELLAEHAAARAEAEVFRVIISDSDFLYNLSSKGAMERLLRGCRRSRALVAMLRVADGAELRKALAAPLAEPRFRLAVVEDLGDFGSMARQLADALWGAPRPERA